MNAGSVRELFNYDPETGILTHRIYKSSNARAGDVAGSLDQRGYIKLHVNGRMYRAARIIWLWMTGEWPSGEVDHKNMNKADNRWLNLREATHAQNRGNVRAYANNRVGIKGVLRSGNMWAARIVIDGKLHSLGRFETSEAAAEAYRLAAMKHFGEFARGE